MKFCVPQPESITTAESGSATDQVTVTSLVYQPFAPAVPVTTFVIAGGVESGEEIVHAKCAGDVSAFPASSIDRTSNVCSS